MKVFAQNYSYSSLLPIKRSRFRWLLVPIIGCIVLLLLFNFYNYNDIESRYYNEMYVLLKDAETLDLDKENNEHFRNVSSGIPGCRLPLNMDPNHQSIQQYIRKLSNFVDCSSNSDSNLYNYGADGHGLTYTNNKDGIVYLNTAAIDEIAKNDSKEPLVCYYRELRRKGDGDDDHLAYTKYSDFPKSGQISLQQLGYDYMETKCEQDEQVVYRNIHSWPTYKLNRRADGNDRPNVIILVVESLSRMNYERFMVKTQQAIKNHMSNMYTMKGLVKMADNSFPNMLPFLTGYRAFKNELPQGLNESTGPFDDFPFIWKHFKSNGYHTGLIEDRPELALFNYLRVGFKEVPTDWYVRPYWLKVEDASQTPISSFCYKQRPKVEMFLDQIRQVLNKQSSLADAAPLFLFSFYIQVTHDDFNKAQLIDSHLADFVNQQGAVLNDSIFILMGDHGNRFGSILETVQGRLEERLPLFSIHVPERILAKYPTIDANLKTNSERLTNWLDMHQMLLDISNNTYTQLPPEKDTTDLKRSYSIMREPVALSRSCSDANIPDAYCVCDERRTIRTNSTTVIEAATALINSVNERLQYSPYSNLCKPLTLGKIQDAAIMLTYQRNSLSHIKRGFEPRMELTVVAEPSKALFRAQMYRNMYHQNWTVRDEVNRLNSYKGQSDCIKDVHLRLYCYCV